ncbi:hypothetical protein BGP77_12375 [Saccharospirillum sp. MSK14-1]|uniref:substrate-binding periplasmic protein n=1 Tax=Saccharospirillum sp. MSK14-1 TaxID=1897632 RepID=UPI000D35EDCD|nr:transporter substrate-binding domain-containing protein [Saccharospirillum sp. MSK14-1]PTY38497.1 hypothetical protein BGP77_12375 [Saccharospirillum sp. MSK14-1]
MKRLRLVLAGFLLLGSAALVPGSQAETTPELNVMSITGIPSAELAGRIMTAAYAKLGWRINIVRLPANRALVMAINGEADADMMRIAALDGRYPELVQVPYPLLRGELRAVTRNSNLTHWDPVALADQRIAIRRGVVIAERATAGMQVTTIADAKQFLPMLLRNRVDILVVSNIEGIDPFEDADWSQLKVLENAVAPFTLHHYLHRRHADLAQPLADVLANMHVSGETDAITARFLEETDQADVWQPGSLSDR